MAGNPCVLLLRHGETEWNREGRLQGRDDSPLSARGRAQAESLARFAARLGVGRVISSPLGRAHDTARVIATACGVTVELADALVEIDFGHCSGGTMAEGERRFPRWIEARQRDRWHQPWPGGESYVDVLARVGSWLAEVGELRSDPPTVVVAHQSLHRAMRVALGVCTRDEALQGAQTADEVFRVDSAGRVELLSVAAALARNGVPTPVSEE